MAKNITSTIKPEFIVKPADAALGGALLEIARHGGGTVEGYPEETDDRTVAGSFLHTGPMAAFEKHGFTRTRLISPHRWVVTKIVSATAK
jgi:hypothetical protein